MTFALPLLVTSLVAVAPANLEATAERHIALEFERVGRRTPVRDEALSKAARELATLALEGNAQQAAELVTLTEALSGAQAWDPSPKILVIKGAPAGEPVKLLSGRKDLAAEPASHVGIGAVIRGDASAVVMLFTLRRARLERFVRQYSAPPGARDLCGVLEAPLQTPEVAITRPDGSVVRAVFSKIGATTFCAKVLLDVQGRYTLEVLGRGPGGPVVAALFFVNVGVPAKSAMGPLGPEPKDVPTARAELLDRMNALRRAHGVAPLGADPEVTRVAQAYSERMAKEHFFAHVSPEGESVGGRLKRAGYPYRGAGENLGSASGALAAHFGIEHSPGHRKNLLDPAWSRVGIGIATEQTDAGKNVVVTQIFVDPLGTSKNPLTDAYRAIGEQRAQGGLRKLERDGVLERLALDHARRALAADEPKAELPGGIKLHDRIFEELQDVKSASVDFFVADSPALIEGSKAAANPAFGLVGVGAVKGDSARFGKDKYWVVVIYAAK